MFKKNGEKLTDKDRVECIKYYSSNDHLKNELQKIIEIKDVEDINNTYCKIERNALIFSICQKSDYIHYPDTKQSFYIYEHCVFTFEDNNIFCILEEDEYSEIINDAIKVKQLNHIIQSLRNDLNSGILEKRMDEHSFLNLKKELQFFNNHFKSPIEYLPNYFVKENSINEGVALETTDDLFKRFKYYTGLTAIR